MYRADYMAVENDRNLAKQRTDWMVSWLGGEGEWRELAWRSGLVSLIQKHKL